MLDKNGNPITDTTLMSDLPEEALNSLALELSKATATDPSALMRLAQALKVANDDECIRFHVYAVLDSTASTAEQKECVDILSRFQTHVEETQSGEPTPELVAYLKQLPNKASVLNVYTKALEIVGQV